MIAAVVLMAVAKLGPMAQTAPPALTAAQYAANLGDAQIVTQMQQHSQTRSSQLKQYKSTRHYNVEYHGFATTLKATMEVEASFDAAAGKSLRIISQSGSKILCEKVLRRAVESEEEASADQASTALTERNYHFNLVGDETVAGRPAYVLSVDPIADSKFLFRGKIWVDAADFAVVKMEMEPAKNPSFWISRTLIHSTSTQTDGFWLPRQLRSDTKVRIGGTAVLTIDYGAYAVLAQPGLRAAAH
jgi:negative regulator of sigma E activity